MKKVVFETIGNLVMFVLLALLITEGVTFSIDDSFVITMPTFYVPLFLIYMIVYLIILVILNKKQGASFSHLLTGLQLKKDVDEREAQITREAGRVSYLSAIIAIPCAVFVLWVTHFFGNVFSPIASDFQIAVWLLVACMAAINVAFSVKWCQEYRK